MPAPAKRPRPDSTPSRLGLLTRLRDSDMSIRDMKAYARLLKQGKSTLDECRTLLTGHRAKVSARAQALQETLAVLDKKIAIYDGWITRR